jgi:hypothetical protein
MTENEDQSQNQENLQVQSFKEQAKLIRDAEVERENAKKEAESKKREAAEEKIRRENQKREQLAISRQQDRERKKQQNKELVQSGKSAGLFISFVGCGSILLMPVIFIGVGASFSSGSIGPMLPSLTIVALVIFLIRVAANRNASK